MARSVFTILLFFLLLPAGGWEWEIQAQIVREAPEAETNASSANKSISHGVAAILDANRHEISQYIEAKTKRQAFEGSYTVVWRQYEDAAIEAFAEKVKELIPTLANESFHDGDQGSEKNRLADLEIRCGDGSILISIKTATAAKNPENDLGTFRQYPDKKAKYRQSFDIWLRWKLSDDGRTEVDRVFFDQSFRFVGKMAQAGDGVKYRKKDGNMRPKSWEMFDSDESYWNTIEEFEEALERSRQFRANSLVKEHLENMTKEDQRDLYEELKRRFED